MAGSSARREPGWERHVIDSISYVEERVVCSCGWAGTASRDVFAQDRHLPLANAFAEHRVSVGAIRTGGRRPATVVEAAAEIEVVRE